MLEAPLAMQARRVGTRGPHAGQVGIEKRADLGLSDFSDRRDAAIDQVGVILTSGAKDLDTVGSSIPITPEREGESIEIRPQWATAEMREGASIHVPILQARFSRRLRRVIRLAHNGADVKFRQLAREASVTDGR